MCLVHAIDAAPSLRQACFLGCGQQYRKSSVRSIRRHVLLYHRRWFAAEGADMSDAQLYAVMASQQEDGTVYTGLSRWRLRKSGRTVIDLPPHERWECTNGCGQHYRITSSKSIGKHVSMCNPCLDKNGMQPANSDEPFPDRTGVPLDRIAFSSVLEQTARSFRAEHLLAGQTESVPVVYLSN